MSAPVPIQELSADWLPKSRDTVQLTKSVVAFYRTLDAAIEGATRRSHAVVACRRGCDYCCHIEVRVRAHEALVLAEWITANLDPGNVAVIAKRAKENAAKTELMGREARRRTNLRCALLGDDGACMAYAARPGLCRKFHSTNLPACIASYEDRGSRIPSPESEAVAREAMALLDHARNAIDKAGLDTSFYDLNRALAELLGGSAKALRRWRAGKKIIAGPLE